MDKQSFFIYFFKKHPMKLIETTNPSAHAGAKTLFSEETAGHELEMVRRLRFIVVGMYYAEIGPEWSSDGHCESDYLHHIDIAFQGRRQVVHEGRVLTLEPGHAYFLPGNVPVERRCQERCQVMFIKFRSEWLPGVDPLLDWPKSTPTLIGSIDVDKWQACLATDWKATAAYLLHLHAQIQDWMAEVLPDLDQLIRQHRDTHAPFEAVFDHLEKNLGADLRVTALAQIYGTSLHAFSMAFSSNTGISPKHYITRRLNQEAIQLVLNTNLRVKQIAERLRFLNEYYFSRFFQKLNGAPPSQYRQRFRTGHKFQ